MLVTLIGKEAVHKIILPQITEGSYWITDKNSETEKKLVNIEGKNGKWQITSNRHVKVIKPQAINIENNQIKITPNLQQIVVNKVILEENKMYSICIGNLENLYIVYCSAVYEDNFIHLNMQKNTKEFFIGTMEKDDIIYKHQLLAKTHARIFLYNDKWVIENLDKRIGTFVNNKVVKEYTKTLENGDVIFIMGLKIIILGNSIFVNNPLNNMRYNSKKFELNKIKYDILPEDEEDKEEDEYVELYSENDYFSRAPRLTNKIETEKIKIDAPPQIESKEQTPMILVLGSSLSMGILMIISATRALDGYASGTSSIKETIFQLIIAFAMLISMILFPILNIKYEKKRKIRYEQKRQKRYKEYINKKIDIINEAMVKQRKTLLKNYVTVEECTKIILNRDMRLWERKIEDYDFLTVRLGIGEIPLDIDIQYPEEKFMMDDDNLIEILNTIANKSKILKGAPVIFPLSEKHNSAIISQDEQLMNKMMENLIIQLITFHDYEDLKLVFLLKEDKQKRWEYLKMLPHIWNNTKEIRFFADNYNEMEKISMYLEEDLKQRLENKDKDYKSFTPYYLIITDDYKEIEDLKIIQEILKIRENVGFSLLCLTKDLMQLPNEIKTFVDLTNEKGKIFESEMTSNNQREFTLDSSEQFYFEEICQEIANIPIKYRQTSKGALPSTYSFLEMYGVGLIEQLNILERWRKNDATLSLQVPIGVDSAKRQIYLDIHEKFHGPHGLIAGSTGSGKSEFIITYILSLAVNYHPDDVSFILIDYKGGGLAGAFQKGNASLPHIVGTITNIDTVELQRSLTSIQSELRRRQILFNQARNMTDEGTIDIYKYQKLYHEGIVKEPIPHLLIICDEFAELKQQQNEFMDELISVSRIGRSLGVHLILATQKPAGIVNEQIRSNSRFAVCLKVQSREDSNDVIKRPDASNLKNQGQFYLQVGNDEYFTLGQSAWTGAPYYPSNQIKKVVDSSIDFISNIGTVIKQVDDTTHKKINNNGEQLTRIVQYISEISKRENIKTKKLWLDNIPETIFLKNTKNKYKIKPEPKIIKSVIGEYDDPYNQRQGIVTINLTKGGNTIIYGNGNSGKETLLSTMIYDIIQTYSTQEVWLYLLDFGSEALKIFRGDPHTGDIVYLNEEEKIDRFFEMISQIISERKAILSNYGGNYELYIKANEKIMPLIVIVMNNYDAFSELYQEKYDDILLTITREGENCGIVFVFTANAYNSIRYRLTQNFKQKIALQLNSSDDYYSIYEKIGEKRPSNIFGRGLISIEGEIYEFQTAKVCKPEDYNLYIKETIENLKKNNKLTAKNIPILPDKVTYNDVKNELKTIENVPIGITKKDLKIYKYDFKKNLINIITSKSIDSSIEFASHIIEEIRKLNDTEVTIIDAERTWITQKIALSINCLEMENKIQESKKADKYRIYIINGLERFLIFLEEQNKQFSQILKKAEENENSSFIIIENAVKLKNHAYDDWYKNYVTGDDGIWVGKGFDDQYIINIDTDRREIQNNCDNSFGYVTKLGIPTQIKLLEMKESDE